MAGARGKNRRRHRLSVTTRTGRIDTVTSGAPCSVNAHSLNLAYRDQTYGNALQTLCYLLNDGIRVSIAARMRGVTFPDDLNGSDFTLGLLTLTARRDWGYFSMVATQVCPSSPLTSSDDVFRGSGSSTSATGSRGRTTSPA